MLLDYTTLEALRSHHPAWRLLNSPHASLIASFLQRVFIAPNVRAISAADLAEMLEDELYILREQFGDQIVKLIFILKKLLILKSKAKIIISLI